MVALQHQHYHQQKINTIRRKEEVKKSKSDFSRPYSKSSSLDKLLPCSLTSLLLRLKLLEFLTPLDEELEIWSSARRRTRRKKKLSSDEWKRIFIIIKGWWILGNFLTTSMNLPCPRVVCMILVLSLLTSWVLILSLVARCFS